MNRKRIFVRDFYFKAADDSFVQRQLPAEEYRFTKAPKYSKANIFLTPKTYNKNANPLVFRASPEKLFNLVIQIVNESKLPSVYTWQIEDVCRWIRAYGYPQYQNTLRVNMVNGRTLLLLDASNLPDINIKDFAHIRHIAYGIRCLFHFEMAKFARSISLPAEHYWELYKLLRVKNGTKYEISLASDLWRRMQLIRPREGFREHWEILERWLKFDKDSSSSERTGGIRRYELYECKMNSLEKNPTPTIRNIKPCHCMPPCECFWSEREKRQPWKLTYVPKKRTSSSQKQTNVLSILYQSFPDRYRERFVKSGSSCRER